MDDMRHRSETMLACLPKSPFSEQLAQLHSDMLGEIDQLRARIAELELKLKGEFAAGKSVFEEKERLQQRVWELEAQRVPGRIALLSDVPIYVQEESMGSVRAAYRAGWNDCREAMLAAAPQPTTSAPAEVEREALARADKACGVIRALLDGKTEYWAGQIRQQLGHVRTEIGLMLEGRQARAQLGAVPEGCALIPLTERMPDPDKHPRVVVYTEGTDFAGEQFFDVDAESLNEWFYEYPEDQPEVCRYATHWIGTDVLAARAAQPAQGETA